VFIRAYLYHGKVESLIADFFSENFKEIKKDRLICNILSRRRRKYKDVGHIEAFMIMLTFKLFSTFY